MTTSRIQSLHGHLLKSALNITEENLSIYVEEGAVESQPSLANKHFALNYTVNVAIDQYTGDLPSLSLVMLEWFYVHYPNHSNNPLRFEVEVLDGKTALVIVTLPIIDSYRVTKQESGLAYELVVPPRLDDICPDTALQKPDFVHSPS